jgi:hypothetical protein
VPPYIKKKKRSRGRMHTQYIGTVIVGEKNEYGVRPGQYLVLADNPHSMMSGEVYLIPYTDRVGITSAARVVREDSPAYEEVQTSVVFNVDGQPFTAVFVESYPVGNSCGICYTWTVRNSPGMLVVGHSERDEADYGLIKRDMIPLSPMAVPSEYDDGIQAWIVNAPCGCYACTEGVQQGHFACSTPPPEMVEAEKRGEVFRSYTEGRWMWIRHQSTERVHAYFESASRLQRSSLYDGFPAWELESVDEFGGAWGVIQVPQGRMEELNQIIASDRNVGSNE